MELRMRHSGLQTHVGTMKSKSACFSIDLNIIMHMTSSVLSCTTVCCALPAAGGTSPPRTDRISSHSNDSAGYAWADSIHGSDTPGSNPLKRPMTSPMAHQRAASMPSMPHDLSKELGHGDNSGSAGQRP